MKTKSLLGASIVDEAKAIAIIDYCLHGPTQPRPAVRGKLRLLRKKKATRAVARPVTNPITTCPLDNVVLQKHAAPRATTPVTRAPAPTHKRPAHALWQPRQGLSFPRGLCYLLAVQEHNWPSATVELGYYPTVTDLLCSPLVEKFSTYLVEQSPGLYHMKGRYVQGAITLFHARSSWKVGAHMPHRPHPGHNAGYPQRPLTHPSARPPPHIPRALQPRPPLPPQSMLAPLVPLGVPAPKPWLKGKHKKSRGPFHPYAPPPSP